MIKLERIHVKNYKNIAEADLPLGDLNVIVGENNAGKSNLLGVIPVLNNLVNGSVNDVKMGFDVIGGFFGVLGHIVFRGNFVDPIRPLSIELEFADTGKNISYSYTITISSKVKPKDNPFMPVKIGSESLQYKPKTKTGKPVTIFHRENNQVKYGDGIKKESIITEVESHVSVIRLLSIIKSSENISSDYKSAINSFESVLSSHIFYFSPHLLKEWSSKYENQGRIAHFSLVDEMWGMRQKVFWADYIKILSKVLKIEEVIFPENTSDHKTSIPQRTILFKQNGNYKTISDFSDGTVVLLALITKLFSDTSDIFLIEEPENSVHPKALHELIKLMRRFAPDKQFIITTHSPYLLNMVRPEEVFVASLDKKGRSNIAQLPDVKAIKRKLAKGFMDFGDIVFNEPLTAGNSE